MVKFHKKRTTVRKHRRGHRGRRIHRRRALGVPKNTSVQILNKFIGNKIYRCSKSVTVDSYTIAPSSGASAVSVMIDPSGTYGTGPCSLTMIDWNNLKLIFDQYKVNKVKFTFRVADTAADGNSLTMYCRYNYDLNFGSPNMTTLSDIPRVVQKQFTTDFPSYSYTVYPRQDVVLYNSGVLANNGHWIKKMGWCDVNNPVQLLGFLYYITPTNANQTVFINVEYDISFRMNT